MQLNDVFDDTYDVPLYSEILLRSRPRIVASLNGISCFGHLYLDLRIHILHVLC